MKKRKARLELGVYLVIVMYVCFVGGFLFLIGALYYRTVVFGAQSDFWHPPSWASLYQIVGIIGILASICLFFITAMMGWNNDRKRRQRIAQIWNLKMGPSTIQDFKKFLLS
jgi:hypothetical protein